MEATATGQLVIGIGTGRCGTVSLAQLLNAQPDARVTHESEPWLPWRKEHASASERAFMKRTWGIFDPVDVYAQKVQRFAERLDEYSLVGDVAFFWLPYVDALRVDFPDVKVVGLWRDKESYIESAWRKTGGDQGPNFWDCPLCESWSLTFPQYRGVPKRDAIEMYWEDYRRWIDCNADYVMRMDDLNDETKQDDLFNFLGIDSHVHQFERFNVGPGDYAAANGVREDKDGVAFNLFKVGGTLVRGEA